MWIEGYLGYYILVNFTSYSWYSIVYPFNGIPVRNKAHKTHLKKKNCKTHHNSKAKIFQANHIRIIIFSRQSALRDGMPYCRKFGQNLFQIRAFYQSNTIYRIKSQLMHIIVKRLMIMSEEDQSTIGVRKKYVIMSLFCLISEYAIGINLQNHMEKKAYYGHYT